MIVRPLANRRFLITRPLAQSGGLVALLEAAGAVPLLAPMIDIAPSRDPAALLEALKALDRYDLAVFVSPSALDAVATQLASWPAALPVAVIGPGSRERALAMGATSVIAPAEQFDSEGLLAEPALQHLQGKRILLFRGNGGRDLLPETLTARGAQVDVVEAYTRQPPRFSSEQLQSLLDEGCDGVVMTSSEAVEHLFTLADVALRERLRHCPFFCAHPRIEAVLRSYGVTQVRLTASGDDGIMAGLLLACGQQHEEGLAAEETLPAMPPSLSGLASGLESTARAGHKTKPRRITWRHLLWSHLLWAFCAVAVAVTLSQILLHHQLDDMQTDQAQERAKFLEQAQAAATQQERLTTQLQQAENRLHELETARDTLDRQQAVLQQQLSGLAGDQEAGFLADAELTLSLAAQQLQLTGNVSASLAALYRLDERLAGLNKPTLTNLRRALARDIDTLRRMPYVDRVGVAARLDSLASAVDQLTLRVDGQPVDTSQPSKRPSADASFWPSMTQTLATALGAFVSIRRLDQPEAMLLTPAQSVYLREHLKLRLLNARLALQQHEEATYRRDLAAAEQAVRRHFDTTTKPVIATLQTLKGLLAVPSNAQPTDLSLSIAAARETRQGLGKVAPP